MFVASGYALRDSKNLIGFEIDFEKIQDKYFKIKERKNIGLYSVYQNVVTGDIQEKKIN